MQAALGQIPPALRRHAALAVPRYVRWLASAEKSLTLAQALARGVQYTTVVPRSSGDVLRAVAEAIAEDKLKPVIDRVYRLEQISEAMAYVDKDPSAHSGASNASLCSLSLLNVAI